MPAETERHERTLMAGRRSDWPRGAVARPARRGARGVRRGRARAIARARAGHDGRRTGRRGRSAASRAARRRSASSCRSTTRGSATRARSSSSHADGTRHARALPVQRVGREVVAVGPGRGDRRRRVAAHLGLARARSADGARRRLDRGRRRGHARDHRTLPAQPEPQPRAEQAPRSRTRCGAALGRRADRLARRRHRRGRRHRRSRRQRRRVHRARARAAAGLRRSDNPNHAIAADNRRRLERPESRSSRSRCCRTPTVGGRARPGSVRELYALNGAVRGARRPATPPTRRCSRSSASSTPAARSWRSRVPCSRTAAVACTASPSRCPA